MQPSCQRDARNVVKPAPRTVSRARGRARSNWPEGPLALGRRLDGAHDGAPRVLARDRSQQLDVATWRQRLGKARGARAKNAEAHRRRLRPCALSMPRSTRSVARPVAPGTAPGRSVARPVAPGTAPGRGRGAPGTAPRPACSPSASLDSPRLPPPPPTAAATLAPPWAAVRRLRRRRRASSRCCARRSIACHCCSLSRAPS